MKNSVKFIVAVVFSLMLMVPATAATSTVLSDEITVVANQEKEKKEKKACDKKEKAACDKKEKAACGEKKECDKK